MKLTAEQVRESIESRFDFDVWVSKERWQAIADELNAAIGEPKRAVCSECGTLLSDYILCTPCAEKFAVKR